MDAHSLSATLFTFFFFNFGFRFPSLVGIFSPDDVCIWYSEGATPPLIIIPISISCVLSCWTFPAGLFEMESKVKSARIHKMIQFTKMILLQTAFFCLYKNHFGTKIYLNSDFGNFKQDFLIMKLIQNSNFRVQGMFFQQLYWEKSKQDTHWRRL